MRASASHDIVFHDTPVALDHAARLEPLGSPTAGLRDPLTVGWMNVLLSSVYLGVATAARHWLVGYLNERTPSNLGAPLASLPRFQSEVGEIEALQLTSERLLDGLARELDAGGAQAARVAADASLAKAVVSRNAIEVAERALKLTGNPGLSHRNPLQRHYRDALCSRIHTPQEDTVMVASGKAALDLLRDT
jgi:alkylation response protein AidB-like acyl-CoA dehydrogenase